MYKIEFFECRDGSCPVAIFLDSLRNQARAKVVSFMDILTEKGIERNGWNDIVERTVRNCYEI